MGVAHQPMGGYAAPDQGVGNSGRERRTQSGGLPDMSLTVISVMSAQRRIQQPWCGGASISVP